MIKLKDLQIKLPNFSVQNVTVEVAEGEFFALMGPTGSGKTLILESIAGLVAVAGGEIYVSGVKVTRLAPEQRNIGIVYQDHTLFPHLSVLQNVCYGQRYHGISKSDGKSKALKLLDMLGLGHIRDRRPQNLSGGEKQRTAIARALACDPDVVLLDEPLSSLDPQFRGGLRKELKSLHQEFGTTFLMVTHDFTDARFLADRGMILRNGSIEQQGTIHDIFEHPDNDFVEGFIHS